ncbi:hypothetical protein FR742_23595 [Nonomuraea sp. C10]|nr:exonuclease domain-containing protein [Nonomuraea sp. C10]TXK42153.1 hypothetical protein FR742_23595 [Nonomuraea sp. C10]
MTSGPTGYAVIDVETTGPRPSWHDRIVEVGVVLLDPRGLVTGEWSTLVNPERDLGPQRIRGLTAAGVRHAPTFKEIAGSLAGLLRGRVPVAQSVSEKIVHVRCGSVTTSSRAVKVSRCSRSTTPQT